MARDSEEEAAGNGRDQTTKQQKKPAKFKSDPLCLAVLDVHVVILVLNVQVGQPVVRQTPMVEVDKVVHRFLVRKGLFL